MAKPAFDWSRVRGFESSEAVPQAIQARRASECVHLTHQNARTQRLIPIRQTLRTAARRA